MRRPEISAPLRCAAITAGAVVFLLGCGGSGASPAALRSTAVARAGPDALDGATLERWLLNAPVAPSDGVANAFVSSWINSALLIAAFRGTAPLDDSATVDAVIVSDAERGVQQAFFQQRLAARPPVTDAEVDSLANGDRVRVFQQLLLHYPAKLDSSSARAMGLKARTLIKRARDGESFTKLVKEASEDTAAGRTNGFLPALSRAELEPLPERLHAVWELRPNDISNPIPTPAGLHIVRRATKEESREGLRAWLRPVLARHADSLFVDSIVRTRRVAIAEDARPRLRAMAAEPVVAAGTAPFVTWQGGNLAPASVRAALLIATPAVRSTLRNASDSVVSGYLMELSRRAIMLAVITSEKMPTQAARAVLAPEYRSAMAPIRSALQQYSASATPGAVAVQYLDSVFAKKNPARYYLLPGGLSVVLRDRSKVTVDTAAVRQLVTLTQPAWRLAHANDSSATRPAGAAAPQ